MKILIKNTSMKFNRRIDEKKHTQCPYNTFPYILEIIQNKVKKNLIQVIAMSINLQICLKNIILNHI